MRKVNEALLGMCEIFEVLDLFSRIVANFVLQNGMCSPLCIFVDTMTLEEPPDEEENVGRSVSQSVSTRRLKNGERQRLFEKQKGKVRCVRLSVENIRGRYKKQSCKCHFTGISVSYSFGFISTSSANIQRNIGGKRYGTC